MKKDIILIVTILLLTYVMWLSMGPFGLVFSSPAIGFTVAKLLLLTERG
jgi:hypothetical protein